MSTVASPEVGGSLRFPPLALPKVPILWRAQKINGGKLTIIFLEILNFDFVFGTGGNRQSRRRVDILPDDDQFIDKPPSKICTHQINIEGNLMVPSYICHRGAIGNAYSNSPTVADLCYRRPPSPKTHSSGPVVDGRRLSTATMAASPATASSTPSFCRSSCECH